MRVNAQTQTSQSAPNATSPHATALAAVLDQDGFTPSQSVVVENDPQVQQALQQGQVVEQQTIEQPVDQQFVQQTQQPIQQQQNYIPQARLDEVTAARRQAEREAAELRRRMDEMSSQMVTMMANSSVAQRQLSQEEQAAQEAMANMDPQQRLAVDYMVRNAVGQMQRTMATYGAAIEDLHTAGIRAKYTDECANRANELMVNWQRAGLSGWSKQDAFKYAAGELLESGRNPMKSGQPVQPQGQRATNGQFRPTVLPSGPAQVVSSGAAASGQVPSWAMTESPDFNPQKATAFWEKRLENAEF